MDCDKAVFKRLGFKILVHSFDTLHLLFRRLEQIENPLKCSGALWALCPRVQKGREREHGAVAAATAIEAQWHHSTPRLDFTEGSFPASTERCLDPNFPVTKV